jgi:hypothetical protein
MKIKHIIDGIKNSVFVKEEVEKIAKERYGICQVCPKNSSNRTKSDFNPGKYYSETRATVADEHCTECACNLHAKVRSLHTSCPIDKWEAVATRQEAAKIAAVTDGGFNQS